MGGEAHPIVLGRKTLSLARSVAAGKFGIAENTARSALKVVYEKLGIGKQSELAKIVARLEGAGF